jgi:hypothetical protein
MSIKGTACGIIASLSFADKGTTGYIWRIEKGSELVYQGAKEDCTEVEALNELKCEVRDHFPDLEEMEWKTIDDPFEACSATGTQPINYPDKALWESVEHALSEPSQYCCESDPFDIERAYRTLLETWASRFNLQPQRWNNGSTTWISSSKQIHHEHL